MPPYVEQQCELPTRVRNAPTTYEAAAFWQRGLPEEAQRKGTQRQRTAQLDALRKMELQRTLQHAREEGHAMAVKQATTVIASARTRLMKMAEDLAVVKAARAKEAAEAQAYRRKMEASKRQKTLHAFFASPLQHEARPRARPEALGEGYTARNLTSGIFASTRSHRENGAIAFADDAKEGAFFVVDKSIDSTEKYTLFSIAKDSVLRSADEDITADASGHLAVRKGEMVVDGARYSCVSPGGTVFAPTGLEVVVPIVAIFAFDLDVQELDTSRRTMRNHTRKWQLASEDHSRMLRLLSETLEDQVAAAVRNVSGRS